MPGATGVVGPAVGPVEATAPGVAGAAVRVGPVEATAPGVAGAAARVGPVEATAPGWAGAAVWVGPVEAVAPAGAAGAARSTGALSMATTAPAVRREILFIPHPRPAREICYR
jgi:hypothetical protein